jgi:1,2-diacylglycerol 3-alpha-glucosyltransferase
MKRRLVIITEIISPYRIPLFNVLSEQPQVDLHVIFLAETDPTLRQWKVYKEEIRFSYEVLPSWRKRIAGYNLLLNRGLGRALLAAGPDAILCGGYSYVASWQALWWARNRSLPFFLWSESNLQDIRKGRALVELLKSEFFRQCSGFVVPGKSAVQYLLSYGMKRERIFMALNAVDNDLFAKKAAAARANADQLRIDLALPERYFLFVGRLVREKGIFELLSAYSSLDGGIRQQVGLVFAGDGPCRAELESRASSISPGLIKFVGFTQREQLAAYYALGEAMVLPTYSDPWGLVVNEAMACGLPVIVSNVAGCAPDLVTDSWNGKIVKPGEIESLSLAMRTISGCPGERLRMRANSLQRIAEYSPQIWSGGMLRMLESLGESRG